VANPGFESGTGSWVYFYSSAAGGTGSFTAGTPAAAGTKAAQVTVTTLPSDKNVQLYQYNLTLQPNKRYRLSFAAKSSTGHDMKVSVIKHGSPYTNYGLSAYVPALTSSYQTFTVDFTTSGFTAPVTDGRLMFFLGDHAANGDQYGIDAVSLTPQ
jgi:hypothetical protein